jgi:hypothetical protein
MITPLTIIIILLGVATILMAILFFKKPKPTLKEINRKIKEEQEEEYVKSILSYNINKARGTNG